MVKKLINSGTNLNLKDNNNMTALTWAVNQQQVSIVQILTNNLNAQYDNFEKDLAYAKHRGNTDIIKILKNAIERQPKLKKS